MAEIVLETIRVNDLRDGYVRVLVTRGKGSLGLSPYQCPKATVVVIAGKISLYPEACYTEGLKLITCATRRPTPGALPPQVKSLNYLNNVMAKVEALQAGAQEAVMLNEQGYVAECSGDNLFILKRGELLTPPVSAGALDGITRRVVMEIGDALGIAVREAMMTRFEIFTADECFVTGTAAEVVPVVMLDKRPIGKGRPGPVTARIIEGYHQLTKTTGTPV
jgi:branched-chain amino acid aminotransferase